MARILIVDDDISMRSVMKDCLSPIYEVFDTGEPEAALAMTLEHKPDAILMDLSMPGLSGFELCRVLSSLSITQQIPIFIVSGEDERNRAFCQNLGATRFFTKPVDFTRLKADLDWVLRSKKADRRADPRIQIRVLLKLKGRDKEGNDFETRAETENMSRGGFLCACETPLGVGTSADVLLCGDREINLGHARVVRVERPDSSTPRYGFQFIRK